MSTFYIDQNGQKIKVHAQKIKGQIWVHLNGKTFPYESELQSSRKKKKQSKASGDLISPMPGKVTKILKNTGDEVSSGDVVLVMEAMKMEYTLKAAGTGTIRKINCEVGQQVTLGKILVEIEEHRENT